MKRPTVWTLPTLLAAWLALPAEFSAAPACRDYEQQPFWMTTYDFGATAHDMDLYGDYAVVVSLDFGLHVIDVSNPALPATVGSHPIDATPLDVVVDGDHAYVFKEASLDSIYVFDLSTPASPAVVGKIGGISSVSPSHPMRPDVFGNRLLVPNHSASVRAFDITDPTNPVLETQVSHSGAGLAREVEVHDGGQPHYPYFFGIE